MKLKMPSFLFSMLHLMVILMSLKRFMKNRNHHNRSCSYCFFKIRIKIWHYTLLLAMAPIKSQNISSTKLLNRVKSVLKQCLNAKTIRQGRLSWRHALEVITLQVIKIVLLKIDLQSLNAWQKLGPYQMSVMNKQR